MKKILIPVDFSDNSKDAIKYALEFSATKANEIHFINVVQTVVSPSSIDLPMVNMELVNIQIEAANTAMEKLKILVNKYIEENITPSRLKLNYKVDIGTISDSIISEAKAIGADLIIMGSQGENHSFLEKIIGTISVGILDRAPCPIILVPKSYQFSDIKRIIFATNLEQTDASSLRRSFSLVDPFAPEVRCVYITDKQNMEEHFSIAKFAEYIIDETEGIKVLFNSELGVDVENALTHYAEEHKGDMIVMPGSKRSALKRLFVVSHTQRMLFILKKPLMILN